MAVSHSLKWQHIEDLPSDWKSTLEDSHTLTMVQTWHEQAEELRKKDLFKDFVDRLKRQWAIETGVLEGLYSLSEGATNVLIEKGLDAALISHEDISSSPELVFATIQDHHLTIQGLYQFVAGIRSLGTSYVKELHVALTAHQDTFTARDTLGNFVTRDLPRGAYKKLPNNVEHPDGHVFEYCPPEHVDAEMERLVELYGKHHEIGVTPAVEAAWLHHRFTLIHPFTDGNGRVARCLATLVLIKSNWLPLVITRHERSTYIDSLHAADTGNLKPLVELIGDLQRRALREALSLSEEVQEESLQISTILSNVKATFDHRRKGEEARTQSAFRTADSLQILALNRLDKIAADVTSLFTGQLINFKAYAIEANRASSKSNYHYRQIIKCAKHLKYFANLPMYQAWAGLVIQSHERAEILFSFHGIGKESAGILGCSAMFYSKESTEEGENIVREVVALTDSPFEFNYNDDPTDVQRRFGSWLERCLVLGLDEWRKVV